MGTRDDLETLATCDLCGSSRHVELWPASRIRGCEDCGYVFHSPRPTREAIHAFYARAGKYDHWLDCLEGREAMWRARLRKIGRHLGSGRLLDVGAGIGQFLHLARERYQVAGTELSEEAVALARERYGIELARVVLEEGTPFPDGSFDAVTMIHVLEHVPSPRSTVEACHRLLREGGFLFVAVPNDSAIGCWKARVGGLRTLWKVLTGRIADHAHAAAPPLASIDLSVAGLGDEIHLSHFTAASLGAFLHRMGFEVVEQGLDPFHPSRGPSRWKDDLKFALASTLHLLTGRNFHGALWTVGRKRS